MSRHATNRTHDELALNWTRLRTPRLVLGVGLLLWGYLSGELFLFALVMALLLEASHWIKWRWAFSDEDFVRVWNLCVALFLLVLVFQVMGDDANSWRFTRVVQKWMPALLFPMILAHHFSSSVGVPVVTFSLIARRKRLMDQRSGRVVKPLKRIDLSYIYFALLLLSLGSASVSKNVEGIHFIFAFYIAWALFGFIPKGKRIGATLLLPIVFAGSYVLQNSLHDLHDYLRYKAEAWFYGQSKTDPHFSHTSIGEIGRIKESMDIEWRVRVEKGRAPKLLYESAYMLYGKGAWRNPSGMDSVEVRAMNNEKDSWKIANVTTPESTGLLRIRGSINGPEAVLPAPQNTALLYDMPAELIERNLFGTLISHPKYNALAYMAYQAPEDTEGLNSPPPEACLLVNDRDKKWLAPLARVMRLSAAATTGDKIEAVARFFRDGDFRYSKYLTSGGSDALRRFLTRDRRGHCEYYATATALLLRTLNVPSRYVVGYALQEYNPSEREYQLRGMHRHAWTQAWSVEEQRWLTVDNTPTDWLAQETQRVTSWQAFKDRFSRWLLSWNVWRRSDDKGLVWTLLPLFFAGALLTVVVVRLLRGLRKTAGGGNPGTHAETPRLGLDSAWYALEEAMNAKGWHRGLGETPLDWLRRLDQYLPPSLRRGVNEVTQWHYRYRFDPEGLTDAEKTRLSESCQALATGLSQMDEPGLTA